MGLIIFVLVVSGLAMWIVALVQLIQLGGSKGTGIFFIYLGGLILTCGLLWLVIVLPSLNCHGFLCGIGEILIFLGLSILLFFITPILMLTIHVRRLKKSPTREIAADIEILD
ncbi:MAG: hypothetical protein IPM74_12015 [Crocinitomicaceae bacterium]|nr:hypothetical protein [Crocinitomicaceae bacterium]MBK8926599.1 hypothetical protein [Crocinitomicaceae bacterium]